MVKSYSPSWSSREVLLRCAMLDSDLQSLNWFGRVPSSANLTDGPSRFDYEFMSEILAVQVKPAEVTLKN